MAPSNQAIVVLKLPSASLSGFDFSETGSLDAKKPKKRGGARPRAKKEGDTGSESNNLPSSGIVIGSTSSNVDPVMGSLPRSLKAAPAANTQGLVLDKTPCRKWTRRPLQFRTFTGYSCNFVGWASDYTSAEWEAYYEQERLAKESKEAELRAQEAEDQVKQEKQEKRESSKPESAKESKERKSKAKEPKTKESKPKESKRKPPVKRHVLKLKLPSQALTALVKQKSLSTDDSSFAEKNGDQPSELADSELAGEYSETAETESEIAEVVSVGSETADPRNDDAVEASSEVGSEPSELYTELSELPSELPSELNG